MRNTIRLANLVRIAALAALNSQSALGADARDVYRRVAPSIFVVESRSPSGDIVSQGSAVRVASGVVTNCHVVHGASRISLKIDGRSVEAHLWLRDALRDLCLLVTDTRISAPAVSTRPSSSLGVGEEVFAIGAPLGLELTMSNGIVSSFRQLPIGRVIQTTAPISPGSSGGGLFDRSGQLIGITTSQMRQGQNLNFAVPAEWIAQIVPRAEENRQRLVSRQAYMAEAHNLYKAKDWQGVIRLMEQRLQIDDKDRYAWYRLTLAYLFRNELDAAYVAFDKMLQSALVPDFDEDNDLFAATFLAEKMEDADRPGVAAMVLSDVHRQLSTDDQINQFARVIYKSERYDLGIETFRVIASINSNSSRASAHLGSMLIRTGRCAQGLASLEKSISLNSADARSWTIYLINVLWLKGQAAFDSSYRQFRQSASSELIGSVEPQLRALRVAGIPPKCNDTAAR